MTIDNILEKYGLRKSFATGIERYNIPNNFS